LAEHDLAAGHVGHPVNIALFLYFHSDRESFAIERSTGPGRWGQAPLF
jgi:hypothetical protein